MTQIIEYRKVSWGGEVGEWIAYRGGDVHGFDVMEMRISRTYTKGMKLADNVGGTYEILDDVKYISKNSSNTYECLFVKKTFSNGSIMHTVPSIESLAALKENPDGCSHPQAAGSPARQTCRRPRGRSSRGRMERRH